VSIADNFDQSRLAACDDRALTSLPLWQKRPAAERVQPLRLQSMPCIRQLVVADNDRV